MSDVAALVAKIGERRQHLDQLFFNDIRKLRREHGDKVVDQALSRHGSDSAIRVAAAPSKGGRPLGSARPGNDRVAKRNAAASPIR